MTTSSPPGDQPDPASAENDWDGLDLAETGPLALRPGSGGGRSWVPLGLILAAVGSGGAGYWFATRPGRPTTTLAVAMPATIEVKEAQAIDLQVGVRAEGIALADLRFRLIDPPRGATIAPQTGRVSWTPDEAQGPGTHTLAVRVTSTGPAPVAATARSAVTVREVVTPLRLEAIADQDSAGQDVIRLTIQARDDDVPAAPLTYHLEPGAPAGARVDPASGRFEWDPRDQPSGTYPITVRASRATAADSAAKRSFTIRLAIPQTTEQRLGAGFAAHGLTVEPAARTDPGQPTVWNVAGDRVTITPYPSPAAAHAATAEGAQKLAAAAVIQQAPVAFYQDESTLVRHDGSNAEVATTLGELLGNPCFDRKVTPADVAKLIELARDKGRLFNVKEYRTLRKIFADRFEERYAMELRRAYGADLDAMRAWFQARPEIREEFFTAIDPQHDDVVAALRLFRTLKDEFPAAIEPYANLAIATAVTWDQPRGVYDYAGHAKRTKTRMPPDLLDAVGSFRYLLQSKATLGGHIQYLPWEFLLHIVDHRTPVAERRWALANYGARQSMIGKCYSEVPYDGMMLATRSKSARLNGELYTLPNLKTYGGVCSMQADYAARVSKSIGVPAAAVVGPSAFGEYHAWVMWVELKDVTPTGISFALESHGRYRGDKYYVGTLDDPQTGQEITDRQLELRLHNVGVRPLAKRHAALIMDAYPVIRDQAQLAVADQIKFLGRVMELCPGDEAAWLELAKLARDGRITPEHKKPMARALDQLFATFEAFPDFTWTVFDDLISAQVAPPQKVVFFERLIGLYEAAGRPDLACEARLKQADLLLAADRPADAVACLSGTVAKFPDEGRYVPKLLDRLEAICREHKVAAGAVVRFYADFLPKIPQKRGDAPSEYCMKTYERAIGLFERNGQPALARDLAAELAALKAIAR